MGSSVAARQRNYLPSLSLLPLSGIDGPSPLSVLDFEFDLDPSPLVDLWVPSSVVLWVPDSVVLWLPESVVFDGVAGDVVVTGLPPVDFLSSQPMAATREPAIINANSFFTVY